MKIKVFNKNGKSKEINISLTAHKQTGCKDKWLIVSNYNNNLTIVAACKESEIIETIENKLKV